MKQIVLVLLILPFYGLAQDQYFDSLNNHKQFLKRKIEVFEDSIQSIDKLISAHLSQNEQAFIHGLKLLGVCTGNAKLRKNPNPLSELIATLEAGTQVAILDFNNDYYGVCSGNVCGYINDLWIKQTDSIITFKRLKNKENAERLKSIEENLRLKDEQERKNQERKLISKYGAKTYNKLKLGSIWLGITEEMAIIALGEPDSVNRTVGVWGVHEQWVYPNRNMYVYFENGVLTSYQD